VDASELLLGRNQPSPRKKILLGNALALPQIGRFDIVFVNFLLHHLVTSGAYVETLANISRALLGAQTLLRSSGRLAVYDLDFDGFIDNFPGRAIFALTSCRMLAPILRRLGANTAGIGVCYSSHATWVRIFAAAGLEILQYHRGRPRHLPRLARMGLLIREAPASLYWMRSQSAAPINTGL
jgi:hypothetical protein